MKSQYRLVGRGMPVALENSSKRRLCHEEFKIPPKDVRFQPMIVIAETNARLIRQAADEDIAHPELQGEVLENDNAEFYNRRTHKVFGLHFVTT